MTAIYVLVAICLQTVFVGGVQFCVSGGHHRSVEESTIECVLVCEHDTEIHSVSPRVIGAHGDVSPCTVAEFGIMDLISSLRHVQRQIQPVDLPPAPVRIIVETTISTIFWRDLPPENLDNPSSAQRLAFVRSTRQLI